MSFGLEKVARLSTIILAGLAVTAAAIWAYGRIEQWRSDRVASRRVGIGTTWPYHSGAHLLAAFSVNTRQDLVNIGKSNSKWPRWVRWARTEGGWARAGARYAEELNEELASISILDPAKARAFALEFVTLIRVQRAQTPEERHWRKGLLEMLQPTVPLYNTPAPSIRVSERTALPLSPPPARLAQPGDFRWEVRTSSDGRQSVSITNITPWPVREIYFGLSDRPAVAYVPVLIPGEEHEARFGKPRDKDAKLVLTGEFEKRGP